MLIKKKFKLTAWFLTLIMAFTITGLMPAKAPKAYAKNNLGLAPIPLEYLFIDGGKDFGSHLYYNCNTKKFHSNPMLDWHARYDKNANTLTLNNYKGDTISYMSLSPSTLKIELKGHNSIRTESDMGIDFRQEKSNLAISAAKNTYNANLKIFVNSLPKHYDAYGIHFKGKQLLIQGKADLTISVRHNGSGNATGIYAGGSDNPAVDDGNVSIFNLASVYISCDTNSNDTKSCTGIDALGSLSVSTVGNLSIGTSNTNNSNIPIKVGKHADFKQATQIDLMWHRVFSGPYQPIFKNNPIAGKLVIDKNKWAINVDKQNSYALYEYGTPYTLKVKNGKCSHVAGQYLSGDTVSIEANPAPAGKEFDKWISDNPAIDLSKLGPKGTFFMPKDNLSVIALYKSSNVDPVPIPDPAPDPGTDADLSAKMKSFNLTVKAKKILVKGRRAVKITWYDKNDKELDFDEIEIFKSRKKNSGYGQKPIATTTDEYYINKKVKKGKTYYYKIRGLVTKNGKTYYTNWSGKAKIKI